MSDPVAILVEHAPGERVTTLAYVAPKPSAALLLAHGAGADQRHAFMVGAATRLRARGVSVVTFDFPYTEKKRRAPDPNATLERCLRAVLDDVRARREIAKRPLFIGGKSMGGRIASQVAAKDATGLAGLVFLGYPLHPPGKPDQLRAAHLPDVRAPMLFVQGERDPFGTPDELLPIVRRLAKGTRLHPIPHGDHSFAVPKRLGLGPDAILDGVADVVVDWMRETIG